MSMTIDEWHRIVRERDFDALVDLLADDVVFHSPIVHTPQEGKPITTLYLKAAFGVFGASPNASGGAKAEAAPQSGGNSKFHYVREVVGDHDAVLEFVTEMDGITVNGVDMIHWNDAGKITDFKVMVRPLKAINKVHGLMASMLEKLKG
jgi:hypothetical protein